LTTSTPLLTVEHDGPVRIVTMNNPGMLNAMVEELHEALADVWVTLGRDTEARAVVLTGAGRAFSAGGDIPGFIEQAEDLDLRRKAMRTARLLVEHMAGVHLPVIAAVNGAAVGLGCSIATSCDLVLMADDAYLQDPHVTIGLVAGDGGVVSWPFMMSMLKVKEYLFTGRRISAVTAVDVGLANRVVPRDDLLAEAVKLAHELALQPPQALQETKRALNLHLQHAALKVLPFALAAESESFASRELRTTIEGFAAKSRTKPGA
jgi:enoyl-CoA hydratase